MIKVQDCDKRFCARLINSICLDDLRRQDRVNSVKCRQKLGVHLLTLFGCYCSCRAKDRCWRLKRRCGSISTQGRTRLQAFGCTARSPSPCTQRFSCFSGMDDFWLPIAADRSCAARPNCIATVRSDVEHSAASGRRILVSISCERARDVPKMRSKSRFFAVSEQSSESFLNFLVWTCRGHGPLSTRAKISRKLLELRAKIASPRDLQNPNH